MYTTASVSIRTVSTSPRSSTRAGTAPRAAAPPPRARCVAAAESRQKVTTASAKLDCTGRKTRGRAASLARARWSARWTMLRNGSSRYGASSFDNDDDTTATTNVESLNVEEGLLSGDRKAADSGRAWQTLSRLPRRRMPFHARTRVQHACRSSHRSSPGSWQNSSRSKRMTGRARISSSSWRATSARPSTGARATSTGA